jgi:integrase
MSDQSFTGTDLEANGTNNQRRPFTDTGGREKCARSAHGHSKTDLKFWKDRIFKPAYRRSDGTQVEAANFAVEISFRGRRVKWTLATPNREAAAARAKEIYLFVVANGWEAALSRYRPKEAPKLGASEITVGEFLVAVRATSGLSDRTFADYSEALRRIVAAIAALPDSNRKYDKVNGGRSEWIGAIGRVRLAKITPEALERWKRAFLAAAKPDPISQRSARVSVNSYLRRAKCLFAKELLAHLDVTLPEPLPFSNVKFEKRANLKYHSDFDVRVLVAAARAELASHPDKVELFKIFVLATMCGLRRHEIDLLPWTAFRWNEGVLRIEATEFFQPKSDDSNAELPLDPEVCALFRGYYARAKGNFVIESDLAPNVRASYLHYRCGPLFGLLSAWLRAHGVRTLRPLHTLRKEFGSLINQSHGIHAASRALRHASIAITAEVYVDSRVRSTSGLGYLLTEEQGPNVLPLQAAGQ